MVSKVKFAVSKNSPFSDGYDIDAERVALAELIESDEDVPESHPLYARFEEYVNREEELIKRQRQLEGRNFADSLVPDNEAYAMKSIGSLVSEESDTMAIHTRDALRIYIGRSPDAASGKNTATKRYGITSGTRVAGILRDIWNLSVKDNPYADWFLIKVSEQITELRNYLAEETCKYEQVLERDRQRGLHISVLKSREPKIVELRYKSPYGYMITDLVLDFDYYVRVIKTLVQKNRLDDDAGSEAIRAFAKKIRSLFESTLPYQKCLLNENMKPLSRLDFLPNSDEQGKKRASAAISIFGALPAEVFSGDRKPPHTKRRVHLSDEEKRLLNEVSMSQSSDEDGLI